ncbi:MAG: phosphotransacetylase family protein [Coriobacteriia bacterium]|nr:phosphotransacetylase family protein [Coriobacteriia bacterium]
MRTIVVTSTKPYTGKSSLCIALIGYLAGRGLDVGYFKPYGTMPVIEGDLTTDEDALYVNRVLPRPSALADVCPVVRTQGLIERVLGGESVTSDEAVRAAFDRCAEGRDVMIVEGPTEPAQGSSVGLSAATIARLVDGRVLLVDRPRPTDLPEDALWVASVLGDRLGGVVLNGIDESRLRVVSERVAPFLEGRGVPVLGVIPHDPSLSSVTVAEIVEALNGTVLTAPDRVGDTVESFMVGAMGQDKALRFFRRKTNKAVITGGDRADVQLAALETSTRCIVLTGNQVPGATVMSRAEDLGVPMVLVDTDTLTAVERMEFLFGRVHLHDPVKAARIREMFERDVDLNRLSAIFGLDA